MRDDTLEDMPAVQTRRRTGTAWPGSPWPSYLTKAAVATFTGWGWTAQDWHEVDTEVGDLFGFKRGMLARAGRRSNYNLREWLRDPPTVVTAAVGRDRFAQAVADHGPTMATNVLDVYAAGASTRFAATFLAKDANHRAGWPQRDVTSAWEITQEAHLTEPAVTGWALTGWLARHRQMDGAPAEDVGMIARRITAWADQFGPGAYLYVLAGFTLEEAITLRDAGDSPTGEQLRVMAALNGHTLPVGV